MSVWGGASWPSAILVPAAATTGYRAGCDLNLGPVEWSHGPASRPCVTALRHGPASRPCSRSRGKPGGRAARRTAPARPSPRSEAGDEGRGAGGGGGHPWPSESPGGPSESPGGGVRVANETGGGRAKREGGAGRETRADAGACEASPGAGCKRLCVMKDTELREVIPGRHLAVPAVPAPAALLGCLEQAPAQRSLSR